MKDNVFARISGVTVKFECYTTKCAEIVRSFLKDFIVERSSNEHFLVKYTEDKDLLNFGFDYGSSFIPKEALGMNVGMGYFDKKGKYAVLPDVTDQSVPVAEFILDNFLRICLQYVVPTRNGVILHSSAIVEGGKSLVFVAPNEGGKSTIAVNSGKPILSDDCVGIKKDTSGDWLACGTPWGDIYSKGEYPIKGIFFIKKADSFSCRKVDPLRALKKLFSNLSLTFPDMDKCDNDVLDKILGVISEISSAVPFFEVGFCKDDNIVELLTYEGIICDSEVFTRP